MKDEEKKSMLDSINSRFDALKKKLFGEELTPAQKLAKFSKTKDENLKPEKFEELLLVDGTTKIVIEPAVEIGAACVLYTAEGEPVPAPAGEYQLQDGRIIIVEQEGLIAEVKEAVAEEEELKEETKNTSSVDEKVKRIIERIETEKIFEKVKTIDAFEKRISELEKTNKFLKEENESLKKDLVDNQKENLDSFKKLLGEPEKKPAVQKPTAFKVSDLQGEDLLQSWLAKHNND